MAIVKLKPDAILVQISGFSRRLVPVCIPVPVKVVCKNSKNYGKHCEYDPGNVKSWTFAFATTTTCKSFLGTQFRDDKDQEIDEEIEAENEENGVRDCFCWSLHFVSHKETYSQFYQHFTSGSFTKILLTKRYTQKPKVQRSCSNNFRMKTLLIKCWWNWHLQGASW